MRRRYSPGLTLPFTSSDGVCPRQAQSGQVGGRVEVAVDLVPAAFAGVGAFTKGQCGFYCPALPAGADSTGQRKKLGKLLPWFHISECLARPIVQTAGDGLEIFGAVDRQVGALGHVLP